MIANFVGVKKPYTSTKTQKTYFSGWFSRPASDAPDCSELLEVEMPGSLHAKLLGVLCGTPLDIDLAPRTFAGKIQGMELVGING